MDAGMRAKAQELIARIEFRHVAVIDRRVEEEYAKFLANMPGKLGALKEEEFRDLWYFCVR